VAGVIGLTGSAREPELDVSANVTGARLRPDSKEEQLSVGLRYSAARETYTLNAHAGEAGHELELVSAGRFGWFSRGLGKDWSAKGRARLTSIGLARLGRLLEVPIEGEISSNLVFDVTAKTLEAEGDLNLLGLSLDRHPLGNGSGRIVIADGRAETSFRIAGSRSTLELLGHAGVVPTEHGFALDPAQTGVLRATAQDFELATLGVFARGAATRVSGVLNGRAEVDWGTALPGAKRPTTLRANATVRDGTFSLVAGGGLIRGVEAQALADGDGPLRVTFSGAARSRKPNLKGAADVRFEGPRFKRLDAKFELDGFPLLYDGVLMGRATTGPKAPKLAVAIVSADSEQTVEVDVPAIIVKLPESTDKKLIALEDDPAIAVADAPLDPDAEQSAASGPGTTLKVRLGEQVVVKRDALEVPVTAALTVAPDGKLTGTITLRQGGVVPALGQTFRITRGTVTFKNQDVKDGTLAIETSTRAADGTLIELAVTGTVSVPVVAFRSDPPRSKNEIIALLLGIQADSTNGSDGEQLGRTAMALAMNRLVEGSVLSALQFGAGETSEGEAVSSVSMRVGSKVWLEGRTVKGSTTSVNPNERVSGVVDWRFAPSWSLRTQLGDISGVELRWSLRY
jgi:hypothetical protein